jgi:DNA-binding FrmR family transcriptional regulator
MRHEEAVKRMKTIEGHVRGIERMLEDQAYCIDVIRQIQAVQAALNKVSTQILEEHMNSCLITAVRGDNPDERERVLKEITQVFEAATRTWAANGFVIIPRKVDSGLMTDIVKSKNKEPNDDHRYL